MSNEKHYEPSLAGATTTSEPGPLGLYRIAKDQDGRLYLDHLAFGARHLPPEFAGRRSTAGLIVAYAACWIAPCPSRALPSLGRSIA